MTTETVLITGASAGIGREMARQFAAEKSKLVLVARRRERLEELAADLRKQQGVEVHVLAEDLGRAGASQAIVDRLTRDGVTIDVLVNNAGFGLLGPVAELDVHRQMEMIQVNVAALTHLTRLLLPAMIERRRGGILNVASTAGFQAGPFMAVYYATKAYVISFSEALANELAGTGVTVSCLCPGPTATEFAETAKMGNALLFRLQTMTAQQVARVGHHSFRRGKLLVVPGWINYLSTMGVRFVPRSMARGIVKRLQWDQ
ncbi:MAG: SDR family oxidoreductase [Thermoguttaceae bacterium]|jgi:short-subunit dehydrogenase